MPHARAFVGAFPLVLAACGVFGSDDPPAAGPAATPEDRSKENAVPPVTGVALQGIFVSASRGDDAAAGTEDQPVKTLSKAIALAGERQLRVLACAETYPEVLVLRDGVSIYADLDCNAKPWARKEGARSTLQAPSSPALVAKNIAKATRVEALDVLAPSASDAPDASSIAVLLVDSKNLTLAKATITAGDALGGTDGVDAPPSAQSATGDADGRGASGQIRCSDGTFSTFTVPCNQVKVNTGALGGSRTCAVGPQPGPGGKGGDGRVYNNRVPVNDPGVFVGDGLDEAGKPSVANAQTARGGVNGGAAGTAGANGANGADGANGAWSFTANGFVRGNGSAGQIGAAGQGGGGASGREEWCTNGVDGCAAPPADAQKPVALASNGAGGGAGGCAGVPGTAGTGGGASVALLAWKSPITLEKVKLASGTGGRAGAGTLGLAGQPGGNGGAFSAQTFGGGPGGRGGHPGLSGHGAPGPSVALAYTDGQSPIRIDLELVPGRGGEGQPALTRDGQSLPAVAGESSGDYVIKP